MRKVFIASLAVAPLLAATVAVAQQTVTNPHPQEKAKAEKLTQAPGGSQTSLPQHTPANTTSQATTSTTQPPVAKEMNQQGAARLDKEGK
ncbi:MAG: hypothetical protein JOY66_19395 [Acetobacteraceae bacterium]|nr:hypothetical protein [Acetobacteraceae bacterium]